MSSFLTQCPHCLTSFRVTDAQLEAADGLVRCGACLGIFSAAANRITLKQTPEEAAAATPVAGEPETDDDFDVAELVDTDDAFETEEDEDEADIAPEQDEAEEEFEPEDTEAFADTGDTEDREDVSDEFVIPEPFIAEPSPVVSVQFERGPAPVHDSEPEHALLDQEDFDIPLGDLNLDGSDDSLDDAADTQEDEYEEDDLGEDDLDEDDDAEDEFEEEEEYDDEDFDEETEDAEPEDDEELLATADEAFNIARRHERDDQDDDEYDDDEDEAPPPVIQRAPVARVTADKTELRRYLAKIEDDEALEPLDDDALDDFEEEPVLLDTAPRRGWLATTALVLANVLLILVLAWQYADANIATLSRSASFATWAPYVCRVVECPPPERSQLEALVSEQLLVRSHPRYAQALEVNLVFRNDAAEAQPFPAIELGFHDTGNRLLANRLFQPGEYLPAELRTSDMPARSSLQVTLEMVDPGSEAVNYTLVFRKP